MVPLTQKPNLKLYRDYDEHDVINGEYAHVDGSVNKGTLVSVLSHSGSTSPYATGTGVATPLITVAGQFGSPSYAYSPVFSVSRKVNSPGSGAPCLGILTNDIRPYDVTNSNSYMDFRQNQWIKSGHGCKIVTKGIFETNNWTGTTPAPGLGGYANSGVIVTTTYAAAKASPSYAGKWLSTPDSDGYARFKVEC